MTRALRAHRPPGDAGADDGCAARRPPRAGAGRQAGPGCGGRGVDLRQPAAVRRRRGPRRLPPHPDRGPGAAARAGASRWRSRRRPPSMYPDGLRTSVQPGPLGDELEGALAPSAFRGRADRRAQAAADRAPGPGVLRREGLPAAGADPADGRRPQRRRADRRACRSSARPTGWRCRRATATSTTIEREQAGALSAALLAGMYAASGGATRRAGRRPRGARRGARDRRRLPARCATRTGARAGRGRRPGCWWPPAWAAPDCSTTSRSTSARPRHRRASARRSRTSTTNCHGGIDVTHNAEVQDPSRHGHRRPTCTTSDR